MASISWPSGNPASVSEMQYEILGSAWGADGLIGAVGDPFPIYADATGLQVKILPDRYAHIHGRGWSSGSGLTLPVQPNLSGYPRVDVVVLALDRSTVPWTVKENVKMGAPALSPSSPPLFRELMGSASGKWEFPLGYITVPSNATTIRPEDVRATPIYLGAQPVVVTDYSQLQAVPGPYNGMTAKILYNGSNLDYVYDNTTGWRRADWNAAWGVIGGKEYAAGGALFASGVGSAELYLNMDSGVVATVAGRRYELRCRFRTWNTGSGATQILMLRDTNASGNIRGMHVMSPMTAATSAFQLSYQPAFSGHFTEVVSASRNYLLTGYSIGGLMSIARTLYGSELAGISVLDKGPAAALSTIA